jgi:hypothetical protein
MKILATLSKLTVGLPIMLAPSLAHAGALNGFVNVVLTNQEPGFPILSFGYPAPGAIPGCNIAAGEDGTCWWVPEPPAYAYEYACYFDGNTYSPLLCDILPGSQILQQSPTLWIGVQDGNWVLQPMLEYSQTVVNVQVIDRLGRPVGSPGVQAFGLSNQWWISVVGTPNNYYLSTGTPQVATEPVAVTIGDQIWAGGYIQAYVPEPNQPNNTIVGAGKWFVEIADMGPPGHNGGAIAATSVSGLNLQAFPPYVPFVPSTYELALEIPHTGNQPTITGCNGLPASLPPPAEQGQFMTFSDPTMQIGNFAQTTFNIDPGGQPDWLIGGATTQTGGFFQCAQPQSNQLSGCDIMNGGPFVPPFQVSQDNSWTPLGTGCPIQSTEFDGLPWPNPSDEVVFNY